MQVLEFIGWFLGASWDFFTEVTVPGFNFTFAALFVGLFLANLGLRFLFMILGVGAPYGDILHIVRSREERGKGKKE